jgi:hypothetical protein
MHTVSKYVTCLGQPWDNKLFASINDIIGNQIPATIHFPADAFTRQGGGAFYKAPTQQLLDATFGASPNQESVGPYANANPGTELVESQNVVGVPHCYMQHFLPGPLTPQQAWEMVAHNVIANRDFIQLACNLQTTADTSPVLAMGPFNVPLVDANLIQHCIGLVQHKLPGMNQTPTMAAGQAIAASVSKLVTQQRSYCQDMADTPRHH